MNQTVNMKINVVKAILVTSVLVTTSFATELENGSRQSVRIINRIEKKHASQFLQKINKKSFPKFFQVNKSAYESRECVQNECFEEICSLEELVEIYPENNGAAMKNMFLEFTRQCWQHPCSSIGTDYCVNDWRKRTCVCRGLFLGDRCEYKRIVKV